jgi:antitoxin (DNA-binding transcriptional repressor) of toxin-antitoxin stability system
MVQTKHSQQTDLIDGSEQTISATELARNLSDILNRVHYKGERFVIKRHGETIGTILPLPKQNVTLREFLLKLQELPWPDSDFFDDLEEIHASQPPFEIPKEILEWE